MSVVFADSVTDIDVIPTGLFVDKATGIGGIPRGVITEIFGDEGIGKTSICLQLVANAQQMGLRCLWADVEWAFGAKYASELGVDISKLGLVRERYAEAVLDTIEEELEAGNWDVVILDSVGGILPRAEAEKGADGKTIGGQAGLIAKFCRKVVPLLRIHNVALVTINHSFIDIMTGKLLTSGGRKLAYHKSLALRFRQKQGVSIKQGDRKVGKMVVCEVRKNKLAATEGLEVDGQLIFGTGFNAAADLLVDALDARVIEKKGQLYYFNGEKLGRGIGQTRKAIEDDAVLADKIKLSVDTHKLSP